MEVFMGTIQQFGFDFAPVNWQLCAGQTIGIAQNQALFSLLGTNFGGNGIQTFQLPNLQGRTAIGTGNGIGLSPRKLGDSAGSESISLLSQNMPQHSHAATFTGIPSAVNVTGSITAQSGIPSASLAAAPTANAFLANIADGTGAAPVIYAPAGTTGAAVNLAGLTIQAANVTANGTVAVSLTGGNIPFSIMQPFLAVTTCIAMQGYYPSRS